MRSTVDALAAFTDTFVQHLAALEDPTAAATSGPFDTEEEADDDSKDDPDFELKIMELRRQEFMDICEVELTPLSSSNG